MTRYILVLTFMAASLSAQRALAWEGLDNFIDDMVSCCTIDTGPPINYGPPPAVYVAPPAPAPVAFAAPALAAPPCAAPACCPPPADCCAKMKACWQKSCDWWTSLCAKCCPGSASTAAPYYQPPYVTAPGSTASTMYGEQPYTVGYPPLEANETIVAGPTFKDGPVFEYGPAANYNSSTPAVGEVIPTPLGAT